MYDVDAFDAVVEIDTLPQCDVGAPSPGLVVAEGHLELAYIARPGTGEDEAIVVVEVAGPYAHVHPADEPLVLSVSVRP